MDALKMQYSFEMKAKELDKIGNKEFDSYNIQNYLNEAQRKYVLLYYRNFETDEFARKALSKITYNINITSLEEYSGQPNTVLATLPEDFWFSLKEEVTINLDDDYSVIADSDDYIRIKVKPVTLDEYNLNIKNPYKKPYEELVWRMELQGGKHQLITDGNFDIKIYHLSYLKKPSDINITTNTSCELNEFTHEDIVDIALSLALGEKEEKKT